MANFFFNCQCAFQTFYSQSLYFQHLDKKFYLFRVVPYDDAFWFLFWNSGTYVRFPVLSRLLTQKFKSMTFVWLSKLGVFGFLLNFNQVVLSVFNLLRACIDILSQFLSSSKSFLAEYYKLVLRKPFMFSTLFSTQIHITFFDLLLLSQVNFYHLKSFHCFLKRLLHLKIVYNLISL